MKRLTALLVLLVLFCTTAFADSNELQVSGSATVYMPADCVSASLGVERIGKDLEEVQASVNATVASIVEALKAVGLSEQNISTEMIYISPRYDYSGATEEFIGYSVNSTLQITTDAIDRIGSFIDAAFAAGANRFDSICFSLMDDRDARKQALVLAVQDAMDKAEVIAAAAGKRLVEIREIEENSQEIYANAFGAKRYEEAAADSGTVVHAAEINVSAGVRLTYRMADAQ